MDKRLASVMVLLVVIASCVPVFASSGEIIVEGENATDITTVSATLNGNVLDSGPYGIDYRGFQWTRNSGSYPGGNVTYEYVGSKYELGNPIGELGSTEKVVAGLVADSHDNIFLYDYVNRRIEKYSPSGDHLLGWDVETSVSQDIANHKSLLTINSDDEIYVLGDGGYLYRKYDPQGNVVASVGSYSSGSSPGQMSDIITSIAVDSAGNVYVAGFGSNHQLQKFDQHGQYMSSIGTYGSGQEMFQTPRDVVVDDLDNIYVLDYNNAKVVKYDSEGNYILEFGQSGASGGTPSTFYMPFSLIIDGNDIHVVSSDSRVQEFSLNGTYQGEWEANFEGQALSAMTSEGWYFSVYNVERVRTHLYQFSLEKSFEREWDLSSASPSKFYGAVDVALDSENNIYAVDQRNHRIQKFSSDGQYILSFGSYGEGPSEFRKPVAVAVDSQDNVYVLDNRNSKVVKFDSSGNFIFSFGELGYTSSTFHSPLDIAIDSNDNIYVSDYNVASSGSHGIKKFSSNGEFISKTPRTTYTLLYIAEDDTLYGVNPDVSNTLSLAEFDEEGNTIATWYGQSSDVTFHNLGASRLYEVQGISILFSNKRFAEFSNGDVIFPDFDSISYFNHNIQTGFFNAEINDLLCGTTYYFRAYAGGPPGLPGTVYSEELSFETLACPKVAPEVVTQTALSVTSHSASLRGYVNSIGTDPLILRGIEYGTTTEYGFSPSDNISQTGAYSFDVEHLDCETTYHFRAFATNAGGTSYGEDLSFTTVDCPELPPEAQAPTVQTGTASSIQPNSAQLSGTVVSIGSESLTRRGVEFGVDTSYGSESFFIGGAVGGFTFNVFELACETTYHFRAYATNAAGTAYGEDKTFVTGPCPTAPKNITVSVDQNVYWFAWLNGNVGNNGGSMITTAGFDLGLSDSYGSTYTISNLSYFQYGIGDLACETTYFVRAWAENSVGRTYSESHSFTTSACPRVPSLDIYEANSIGQYTANLSAAVLSDGGEDIINVGFEYSKDSTFGISAPASVWSFQTQLTGLECGTTYYYRAFATNEIGTGYSDSNTFETLHCPQNIPVVHTWNAGPTGPATAALWGYITDPGSSEILNVGFEVGHDTNYGVVLEGVFSDETSFSAELEDLPCGSNYYYRAFATNEFGTAYGMDMQFQTYSCPRPQVDFSIDGELVNTGEVLQNDEVTYIFTITNNGPFEVETYGSFVIIIPDTYVFEQTNSEEIRCQSMGPASQMDVYFARNYGDKNTVMCSVEGVQLDVGSSISFDLVGRSNADFALPTTVIGIYLDMNEEDSFTMAEETFANDIRFEDVDSNNVYVVTYDLNESPVPDPETTTTTTTSPKVTTTTSGPPPSSTTTTPIVPATAPTTATSQPQLENNETTNPEENAETPDDEPKDLVIEGSTESNIPPEQVEVEKPDKDTSVLGIYSMTGSSTLDLLIIASLLALLGFVISQVTKRRRKKTVGL